MFCTDSDIIVFVCDAYETQLFIIKLTKFSYIETKYYDLYYHLHNLINLCFGLNEEFMLI